MATITKPVALDETLQAVNETLGEIKEAILPSNTYIPKVASPTAGNLASLKVDGTIEDSGLAKTDVAHLSTEALDIKMLGWSVPKECPIQNYMDSNRVFHQRVGRVDLGSLTFIQALDAGYQYYPNPDIANLKTTNLYLNGYTFVSDTAGWTLMPNMSIKKHPLASNVTAWRIRDDRYTTGNAFKSAMQGVYLYYELATEVTMNVDGNEIGADIILDDYQELVSSITKVGRFLHVESYNYSASYLAMILQSIIAKYPMQNRRLYIPCYVYSSNATYMGAIIYDGGSFSVRYFTNYGSTTYSTASSELVYATFDILLK